MASKAELNGIRVIVTDAESRLGLYVIRALGRAGCKVTALSSNREGTGVLGFSSRFVSDRHWVPYENYRERLIHTIETLAKNHDVLVPVSTLSIGVVAKQTTQIESKIRFYIPSLESFQTANNKAMTTHIAKEAGIPVPKSYYPLDPLTIEEWAKDSKVKFPMVIKFADDSRSGLWRPVDRHATDPRCFHTAQ